ncbi:MAG: twin-arginine translocase subunit TatC [Spirochaetes bacterium]|nr:twin-arginine translocase subunit TatC [Spirochaetota bacterium]
MAEHRNPGPAKPGAKKKKTGEKKGSAVKKTGKKAAPKKKPADRSSEKAPVPRPDYSAKNILVEQALEAKKNDIAVKATAGLSGFERVLHFFAKHDDSGKKAEKQEKEEEIDPEAEERGDIPMSFVDHLDELRSRILISAIVFFILTVAGFIFSDELLAFINKPFTDTGLKLNVFKLSEGFMMRLKVAAIAALIVWIPFLVLQIWRFILPAITKKDRMFTRISLLSSILLFYTGVAFVYFLLMPLTVKVLLSFVAKDISNVIGASEYISFVFLFCFLMGAMFEFPIVIMVLTRIGILTPQVLISRRKWAIVGVFIISAIITPTQDILTQSLVAIPLMGLYEASIIISRLTLIRKKKKELEG